jgi:CBS domain-containing protein
LAAARNRLLALGDRDGEQLDLKKVGTFPLVHGIRSLALANHLTEVTTVGRIEALAAAGKLPQKLAADLIDSLHFFMGLKLKVGLQELDTGHAVSGGIQMEKLSSLDRDLLKDTLGVVKLFKVVLNQRFHLEAL